MVSGALVEIMKLTHVGAASLEHFGKKLRCDDLYLTRCQFGRERIHQLTPRPKIVLRSAPNLSKSGQRSLQRVRVDIGEARDKNLMRIAVECGTIAGDGSDHTF